MVEFQRPDATSKSVICEPDDFPDIYSNSVIIHVTGQDIALNLYREAHEVDGEGTERRYVGRVRLTVSQAWVVSQLLQKGLLEMARANGNFVVPKDQLDRLELGEEFAKFREDAGCPVK